MEQPKTKSFNLYDSAYAYIVVDNPLYQRNDVFSENYSNEMPSVLLPILKSSIIDEEGVFFELKDAINQVDKINANKLAVTYYDSKQKIIKSPILRFFQKNKDCMNRLSRAIENIDNIARDKKTEKVDILIFTIKNQISVDRKIANHISYLYPEIKENPWFLDVQNKNNEIFFTQLNPVFKKYYAKKFLEDDVWHIYYYPEYTMEPVDNCHFDNEISITLHKPNGKVVEDGVLDSYSCTQYLLKNKAWVVHFIEDRRKSILEDLEDINSKREQLLGYSD